MNVDFTTFDLRWRKANILQFLEGDVVHLPTLRNFAKHDIELNKNTPV